MEVTYQSSTYRIVYIATVSFAFFGGMPWFTFTVDFTSIYTRAVHDIIKIASWLMNKCMVSQNGPYIMRVSMFLKHRRLDGFEKKNRLFEQMIIRLFYYLKNHIKSLDLSNVIVNGSNCIDMEAPWSISFGRFFFM